MTKILIKNIRIGLPTGELMDGEILIQDGEIACISSQSIDGFTGEILDGQGRIALPGFIDIHIHGAGGADFMDGNEAAFEKIASFLPLEGTTSFLATTLTQSPDKIQQAIDCGLQFMKNKKSGHGAEMLGFHLEGPFIHPNQAGAQPLDYIQEPSFPLIKQWFGEELKHLRVVTLAPERDRGYEVITELTRQGIVVSAGHTIATYSEISKAIEHGLTHLTHFANAMSGLHHRDIGVVGAGLLNEQLICEVIADGIHLSEDMLKLMIQVIGADRLILITDSMRAKGLPDGSYTLAEQQVKVVGSKATLSNGILAGSVLKMNDGIKKVQAITNNSLLDIMKMSSINAAKRLGVFDRKGSIEIGKDADIVLLNNHFDVDFTICMGRLVYTREHI